MATVTMKELLEAGVHFGHQVRRWNPKMKDYNFGERNGIYIIDLQKTQKLFRDALAFVEDFITEKPNSKVLFVGTKRQAQDAIVEEAQRCSQYYVNNRWLGGLMTNFKTVQKSIKRLKDIEEMQEDGRADLLTKKERLELERDHEKLMKNLAGIKDMNGLPDLLFVIDVRKEDIAIKEANRLNIPVVAVVDTNCSPDGVDYVIPGNDDALRAIRLFTSRIADSILEAQNVVAEGMSEMTDADAEDEQATEIAAKTSEETAEAKAEPDKNKEVKEAKAAETTEPKATPIEKPSEEAEKIEEKTEAPKVEESPPSKPVTKTAEASDTGSDKVKDEPSPESEDKTEALAS